MLTSSTARSVIAGLVMCCASGSQAAAQPSWQLYDVRDLITALPQDPTAEESGLQRGANVEALLSNLCTALSINCTSMVAGVYGIEAEAAEHEQVRAMLEAIRELYRQQYAVELVVYRAPAAQAPAIGDAPAIPEVSYREQFVVPRRTPVPVLVTSQRAYVSDINAVVATSAAAYEPQTASVDEGLNVSIVVGAGPESEKATSVDVVGDVRRVTWSQPAAELTIPDAGRVRLELPIQSTRTIRAHWQVEFGKPTVVSVAAGFTENECIVVAVTVKK